MSAPTYAESGTHGGSEEPEPPPVPHSSSVRRLRTLTTIGPAFVAAVAYVDPGNFATNFAGGIRYGYQLAWVIVAANVVATLVQYVSSKVGLATGRSVPELCRERFGRRTNRFLWVQAEVVAMATDLAEFVGAVVGLNLVFGIPLLPAGVITAVVAFAVLSLEQRGRRRFVVAVAGMLLLVLGAFAYLLVLGGQQDSGLFAAGLSPSLDGDSLPLVVAIVGATVMPHVIYAHSALQARQYVAADAGERRRRLRLNLWDCVIGLSTAGLINLAMLCVAAALPSAGVPGASTDLPAIHAELGDAFGRGTAIAFGIALIASGFASASVGTYAGQVVMSGFVGLRIPLLLRRALTIVPSLAVLAFAVDPTQALVVSQIVLSFGIPFALVPLVMLSRDRSILGDMVNRRLTTVLLAAASALITALNLVVLHDAFT